MREQCVDILEYGLTDVGEVDPQVLYQFIEETFGVPAEDSKRFLLSFIYGADLLPNPHSKNTQVLGYENQRILSQFPEIEQIHQEIREAGRVVIKNAKTMATRDGALTVNVLGLPTAETRIAKRLSHLLMGYEAFLLDSICRDLDDVSCLIYDGWVGGNRDVTRLEEKIEVQSTQELGFPITLHIKKRNIPGTVDEILTICGHGPPDVANPVETGKVSQLKAWTRSRQQAPV